MPLSDVDLLVYAHNEDASFRARAKAWWEACLSEDAPVGLAWAGMLGFVRIVSNRRVLARPMPLLEAVGHCRSWLEQPNVGILVPGPRHLDSLADLLDDPVGPNLVRDAHSAALAKRASGRTAFER